MALQKTISSDIFNLGIGYDFETDHETLTVAQNVVVVSDTDSAIRSDYANSVLLNKGILVARTNYAVYFGSLAANSTVINAAGAVIMGDDAVDMTGAGSQRVNNFGKLVGSQISTGLGVYFGASSEAVTLNNHGLIVAGDAGVQIGSAHTGGTINNFGRIRGYDYGIDLQSMSGLPTFINNVSTGVIKGVAFGAIYAHYGQFVLTNSGNVIGAVRDAANLRDVVVNYGTIKGPVELGGGNDVYIGRGNGSVTGGVHGGTGQDRFVADKSKETFFGEADADSFVFGSILSSPASVKRDTLSGFSHGDVDKINVHAIDANATLAGNQNFVFIGTDSFAHFHSVHSGIVGMLRFAPATHRLQGNVNGDFAHADFEVNLPGVTALHANDFVL